MHFGACQFDYLTIYAFWQWQFYCLAKYAYFAPKMHQKYQKCIFLHQKPKMHILHQKVPAKYAF